MCAARGGMRFIVILDRVINGAFVNLCKTVIAHLCRRVEATHESTEGLKIEACINHDD